MDKKEIVKNLLNHNILLSPDILEKLTEEDMVIISEKLQNTDALVLTSDVQKIINDKSGKDLNWVDFEQGRVQKEKGGSTTVYDGFMGYVKTENGKSATASSNSTSVANQTNPSVKPVEKMAGNLKVVYTYDKISEKKSIQDFVAYYNARYHTIQSILSSRQELQNITSISRVIAKRDKENIAVIGMVKDINETKKGLMITLEDTTGVIKAFISRSKPELYNQVKDLVLDEVIGCTGVNGDKIIFISNVIWPEIPLINEKKRSPDESFAVFLSDVHIGSNNFLPDEFNRFLNWISGKAGSDAQKEIASKVKYVFIVGDLVDGVGIYPGQEKELVIPDIYKQYETATELLSKIPKHIHIVLCPGNHDMGRIAEPQLKLGDSFSKSLSTLPNLTLVSNPALINIDSSEGFPGFDVLMYHGYSFDYFVANVDSIRTGGGYDRADLIMKFLLRRRHLAPTQGSTLYIPDVEEDPLVISVVPDFLVTGHIHKCSVAAYRGVTMICGSCWQSITDFQKKVGHHPEPARVPVVNLQTREIKIMRF